MAETRETARRARPAAAAQPAAMAQPAVTAQPAATARFCGLPPHAEPELPRGLHPARMRAIVLLQNKWANGTVLRFGFMDPFPEPQRKIVRWAFDHWKAQGTGLTFLEVRDLDEAELRISFKDDGSWSYVGTYNLQIGQDEATMNLGWDLRTEWGKATALHEIGHALGMPHEHQNPRAGIVWDEDKVYEAYARTQGWDRDQIHYNVIRKIPAHQVQGTTWNPTSIMHYPFEPGLIKAPTPYDTKGTPENTQLSPDDIAFIRWLYPVQAAQKPSLKPMQLVPLTEMKIGEQADFTIEPTATRRYEMRTVGISDSKLVLFEERDGQQRFVAADDDSADDRNAMLKVRLVKGRRYTLRLRLHYRSQADSFGVMLL